MAQKTNLTTATPGKFYVITDFDVKNAADRRLQELGFVKGTKIRVCGSALFKATVAVTVRNSTVCIRREQADKIFVLSV